MLFISNNVKLMCFIYSFNHHYSIIPVIKTRMPVVFCGMNKLISSVVLKLTFIEKVGNTPKFSETNDEKESWNDRIRIFRHFGIDVLTSQGITSDFNVLNCHHSSS